MHFSCILSPRTTLLRASLRSFSSTTGSARETDFHVCLQDDRYFLSGSLDGKLRLWNIPDKKVALWNEVDGQTRLITAANFCQNGKYAVIGTYDGRCIFYDTEVSDSIPRRTVAPLTYPSFISGAQQVTC